MCCVVLTTKFVVICYSRTRKYKQEGFSGHGPTDNTDHHFSVWVSDCPPKSLPVLNPVESALGLTLNQRSWECSKDRVV